MELRETLDMGSPSLSKRSLLPGIIGIVVLPLGPLPGVEPAVVQSGGEEVGGRIGGQLVGWDPGLGHLSGDRAVGRNVVGRDREDRGVSGLAGIRQGQLLWLRAFGASCVVWPSGPSASLVLAPEFRPFPNLFGLCGRGSPLRLLGRDLVE